MNAKRTRSWFLPETPDVLAILCQQAAVTSEGMQALLAWGQWGPRGGQPAAGLRAPS